MLINPTLDHLHALGLSGMARALAEQLESPQHQALSFEEQLGLLVDREAGDRANRRLERNLKGAKLRPSACVEDMASAIPAAWIAPWSFHWPRPSGSNLTKTC